MNRLNHFTRTPDQVILYGIVQKFCEDREAVDFASTNWELFTIIKEKYRIRNEVKYYLMTDPNVDSAVIHCVDVNPQSENFSLTSSSVSSQVRITLEGIEIASPVFSPHVSPAASSRIGIRIRVKLSIHLTATQQSADRPIRGYSSDSGSEDDEERRADQEKEKYKMQVDQLRNVTNYQFLPKSVEQILIGRTIRTHPQASMSHLTKLHTIIFVEPTTGDLTLPRSIWPQSLRTIKYGGDSYRPFGGTYWSSCESQST